MPMKITFNKDLNEIIEYFKENKNLVKKMGSHRKKWVPS
jgi:hypothetical protein